VADRHIVAFGGLGDEDCARRLEDFAFANARRTPPRVLYVPTADAEDPWNVLATYDRLRGRAEVSHLSFFPWPPRDLRDVVLGHDVVYVSGGNTANMLAIWRVYGFDRVLREAWEQGAVLCGWSAGMICWFEAGVTDSFGPQLEGMPDGLGFLSGSACPHYDGEELRRPRYQELVAGGFPPGIAADDCVALHYVDTELSEVVTAREGAQAYRVEQSGEARLQARLL
jgi:peptidase E